MLQVVPMQQSRCPNDEENELCTHPPGLGSISATMLATQDLHDLLYNNKAQNGVETRDMFPPAICMGHKICTSPHLRNHLHAVDSVQEDLLGMLKVLGHFTGRPAE